jgi:hypothetical protein
MLAGLLIIVPATVFFWSASVDWHRYLGYLILTLGFSCIAGIVWLYDEVREIRAEAKGASAASEKLLYQIRAWNSEQPHQENVIMSRPEQMTPDEQVAFSARLLSEGFIMPMIEAGFNAWDIAASLARAAGECCSDADQLKALHEILASGYSIAQRDVARRSVPT